MRIFNLDPLTGFRIYPIKNLEKLGTEYGGWVIPTSLIKKSSICYSVGAGEDISFGCEIASRFGCKVYIFDPTPRSQKHFHKFEQKISRNEKMKINNLDNLFYELSAEKLNLIHYFDYGVWSTTGTKKFFAPKNSQHVSYSIPNLQKTGKYFMAQCKKLSSIMKELGHRELDLLKLDIEGAEYEVIESLIQDSLDIKLICVEFDEIHHSVDDEYPKRIKNIIKKLFKNNYIIIAKDDISNYTFLREDIYKKLSK